MHMFNPEEGRKEKRRLVSFPITFCANNNYYRAYSRDLSNNSMFVATHNLQNVGESISVMFTFPHKVEPLTIQAKVVRVNTFSYTNNVCSPTGMVVEFPALSDDDQNHIQSFIRQENECFIPELKITFEPRFCYLYCIDLSIGCMNSCLYCHFSKMNAKKHNVNRDCSIPVDITSLYTMPHFPKTIFLSPYSDPFAENTKELTHAVLSYLLPKGINFILLTKNVIPQKTLDLIADYPNQFEGIGVCLSRLNDEYNKIIEPFSPPAQERLDVLQKAIKTGVKNIRLRMDPLFPLIDDTEENMQTMVNVAYDIGIKSLTATYLFSFGSYYKRLCHEPILKESMGVLKDKCPLQGGFAYTYFLEKKMATYKRFYEICQQKGMHFNTCGCKESRLKEMGFELTCRNPHFYKKQG